MLHNEIDLFDGHCDAMLQRYLRGGSLRANTGHVDLMRGKRYRRYAQFFALQCPAQLPSGQGSEDIYCIEYELFLREMEENQAIVTFCHTFEEAENAFAESKVAAFLSVEGADLLGCDLESLEQAYLNGVRAINLNWKSANRLCGSHSDEPERGLSELGRTFVGRMEQLGILVDVSHMSDRGFWDVNEVLSGPFVATHSNSRNVCPHRRNLTDEQFLAIAEHNGVAGLNLYAHFLGNEQVDIDQAIAHLEHWLELGGQTHIALGADFDGCDKLAEGIQGLEDMDKLFNRLLQRNYGEALLRALFFENLKRVVAAVCSK